MRRLVFILGLAFLVVVPSAVQAHGGEASASADMPAQALAVQALAMLDAHMGAMDARDRVQAALAAKNQDDVRVDRLRAADAALARGDTAAGRRELDASFNTDDRHLIGTSFTGGHGRSRLVAGVLGAALVTLALVLGFWRSRDHPPAPADVTGGRASRA